MSFFRAYARRLIGLSLLLLALAGCGGKKHSDHVVIGEYGSMTGTTSTFGVSTDNGIRLAIIDANKEGGLDGKPLDPPKLYDDEGKPDSALTVVKKLISQDNATAVLGEVASTRSMAAAPACNSAKVPMISPSSTNPAVTQKGPYIFRVCFIDPFQGTAAAKFARQNLKVTRAAILQEATSDYSTGLAQFFKESFTKLGGTVLATQTYSAGDPDFKAQLTAIKALNPQLLYVPGYYGDIGPIAKQAHQIGLNVPLLGGDGWDSPDLVTGAGGPGGALEGSYFTNHSSMDNPAPIIQKFVAEYKAAYGVKPNSLAASGYDAAGVLIAALRQIGKPADGDYSSPSYRAKLRDAIAATKGYKGITGTITLDANRNAVKSAVVLEVVGASQKYVTTINP